MDGEFPVVFLGNFSSTSQLVTANLDAALLDIHPDSTYILSELVTGAHTTRLGSDLTGIFTSLSSYSGRVWVIGDSALVLEDNEPLRPELPDRIAMLPAYPNPFNPSTTIPLEIDQARQVYLAIYDVLGRQVETLVDGVMTAGLHDINWNGQSSGIAVGSGIYFAVLRADGDYQVSKLVLLK
jgi:hypothetical protein